jgi:hypothetical protein
MNRLILGAGLYGIYAALFCARRGEQVTVLEYEDALFTRATYINQARLHQGYHYPRSFSTALKAKGYFNRFYSDYRFCVHSAFDQVYAVSASSSWTGARQFRRFCENAGIRCDEVPAEKYFKPGLCEGAFLTTEYTYDARILKDHLLEELSRYPHALVRYGVRLRKIERREGEFAITLEDGGECVSPFVLNATYAGVNQVHALAGFAPFNIKYELCEIILCKVNGALKDTGVTVMDGPFFSIMPFGKTGLHSLTSVAFTPHITSFTPLPSFPCQERSGGFCSPRRLGNCNRCPAKPESAWPYMSKLAEKYLRDLYRFEYEGSLFSMKPTLQTSEIDDSRPTVIRQLSGNPAFISVLSGKINTVYDLDAVLGGND